MAVVVIAVLAALVLWIVCVLWLGVLAVRVFLGVVLLFFKLLAGAAMVDR